MLQHEKKTKINANYIEVLTGISKKPTRLSIIFFPKKKEEIDAEQSKRIA